MITITIIIPTIIIIIPITITIIIPIIITITIPITITITGCHPWLCWFVMRLRVMVQCYIRGKQLLWTVASNPKSKHSFFSTQNPMSSARSHELPLACKNFVQKLPSQPLCGRSGCSVTTAPSALRCTTYVASQTTHLNTAAGGKTKKQQKQHVLLPSVQERRPELPQGSSQAGESRRFISTLAAQAHTCWLLELTPCSWY